MPAKAKAKDPDAMFAEAIAKINAGASSAVLAPAIAAIVKARRGSAPAAPRPTPAPRPLPSLPPRPATPRAAPRRTGKTRRYSPTGKVDTSRVGTFRRYMLTTIRSFTNTAEANRANAACTVPKFAKNKLDFNWAADNGYITWEQRP